MPCVPPKGLGDLHERGLRGLLDMYESAIYEQYLSDGRESDELIARLTRRRAEVIAALVARQKREDSRHQRRAVSASYAEIRGGSS